MLLSVPLLAVVRTRIAREWWFHGGFIALPFRKACFCAIYWRWTMDEHLSQKMVWGFSVNGNIITSDRLNFFGLVPIYPLFGLHQGVHVRQGYLRVRCCSFSLNRHGPTQKVLEQWSDHLNAWYVVYLQHAQYRCVQWFWARSLPKTSGYLASILPWLVIACIFSSHMQCAASGCSQAGLRKCGRCNQVSYCFLVEGAWKMEKPTPLIQWFAQKTPEQWKKPWLFRLYRGLYYPISGV